MKTFIVFLFGLLIIATSNSLLAQEYFVSTSGNYVNSNSFKTNIQNDLSKYEGVYTAVSETYESAYTYIISSNANSIGLTIISSACMDSENWEQDTVFLKDINVQEGKFKTDNSTIGYGNFGNSNFKFVKVTYKLDGKTIKAEGLVMEEYFMFAEKEK
jgi:hypothetical protein